MVLDVRINLLSIQLHCLQSMKKMWAIASFLNWKHMSSVPAKVCCKCSDTAITQLHHLMHACMQCILGRGIVRVLQVFLFTCTYIVHLWGLTSLSFSTVKVETRQATPPISKTTAVTNSANSILTALPVSDPW